MPNKLSEILKDKLLVGDGAMGTMLYEQGVFLNSCFDELNITRPDLIKNIHTQYIDAGADFIETNSFGANEFKLSRFGLYDQVEKINEAAVEIAKQACGGKALIAGAMGPLTSEASQYDDKKIEPARKAFKRQAKVLSKCGCDFMILETFSNSDELLTAIRAVSEVTDLGIVAQITINENNETLYGEDIRQAISKIQSEQSVTAVGLNCSVGPSHMLSSLEIIRDITDKPISVQPNAGLPRQVDNRMLYMCTPEYMAEFAKRFFEKGARIIGGCCGSTPRHIEHIVRTVHPLDKVHGQLKPKKQTNAPVNIVKKACPLVELKQRSKLGEKLVSGEKIITIELTPPRGTDLSGTIEKAKLCKQAGIDAINLPDGPRASLRLSPMVTALKIEQEAGIETILHFCCRDRNLIGMQSDLLGASAVGLRNMLIITGDPPKLGDYPKATGVFDLDSVALTEVLSDLNCGIDIAGSTFSPPVILTIGVGANPVASDMAREIERFRLKVEAGAEYAITQPVFDEKMLFDFIDAVKDFSIPILAGIWPFTSFKNAEFMANEVPGVVVPQALLDKMAQAKTKEYARATGIKIARDMMEKISDHVQGFAISAPFGNVKIAMAVAGKIDISEI